MKIHAESVVVAMPLVLLVVSGWATASAESTVNVQIVSAAVRDQKIDGATVIVQKNGEQSVNATTNPQGHAQLHESFSDDSSARLLVRKSGYSDLVVQCPCAGMTYAVSPSPQ